MRKLFTHIQPGIVPAGTFYSHRVSMGMPGSGMCFAPDEKGVGNGQPPSAPKRNGAPTSITARQVTKEIQTLIRDFSQENWRVERELVWIGEPAIDPLIAALRDVRDENVAVRCRAARLLGEIGDSRAVGPLIETLGSDPDGRVLIEAVEALEAIDDPDAVTAFIEMIVARKKEDLGHFAIEALVSIFNDLPDENLCQDAIWLTGLMCGPLGDDWVVLYLIDKLDHKHFGIRAEAAGALGQIGALITSPKIDEAAERLIVALDDKDFNVRFAAMGSLLEIGRKKIAARMGPTLKNPRSGISNEVAQILDGWDLWDDDFDEIDSVRKAIKKIVKTIKERIATACRLHVDPAVSIVDGGGDYGSISMGSGLGLRLQTRLELRLTNELVPSDFLTIEKGHSLEETMERVGTLNFLVHHEMAHLIQKHRRIPRPEVDALPYRHFDPKNVRHHANEVLVDAVAFNTARSIYVYPEDEIPGIDKNMREEIAIDAHLALGRIVLRNHDRGIHPMSNELFARMIAVLGEMAGSKVIGDAAKWELNELAKEYHSTLSSGRDDAYLEEVDQLVGEYRNIFREAFNNC